jgi:hypothetical protein
MIKESNPMHTYGTPTISVGRMGRRTQLGAYATAYIVGALFAYGLIRLTQEPDWIGAVSIASSLVSGIAASVIQSKLDAISIGLKSITMAAVAGISTVAAVCFILHLREQYSDIDAEEYIVPVSNAGVHPGMSAKFVVSVPSRRGYLTIRFNGTARDNENCVNGATLDVSQSIGATEYDPWVQSFDSNYTIKLPRRGAKTFALSTFFHPQPGFDECQIDITVASALFHN